MAFLRWLFRKPGEWLQGGGRNVPFVGKYYPTIAQAEQDFLRQQAASQQAAARLAQQQAALQQVGGQAAQTQRELQALLKQLEASSTARQRLLGLEPQLDQARHEIQKVMQDYATLRQLGARVYPPGTLPRPVAAATDVAQFNLLRRRLVGAGADPLYNAPALKALSEVWPRKITTAQELQKFEEFLRKATGSTVAVPGQGGTPLRLSTEQAAKLQQTQKALQEAKAQQENLMRVDPQLVKQLKMLPQETRNAALALQAAKERAATRHLVGGALGGTSIVGGAALSRARTSPGVGKGRGADDSVNSTAVAPAIATTPLPTGSTTGGTSDDKGKTNNNWMSSPAFLIPASALALGGLGYGLYSSYRRNANDEDEDEKMASSRDVIDRLALASVLVKQANIPQMGVQQYMPVGPRRELSPEEEARLRKGKSRWFPRIFESYNMDPTEAMADPLRSAALNAVIPTLAGAGIGGLLAGQHNHEFSPVGAAVGGLGLGGLSGLLSYWQQQAQNESMEDLIRRHPPGASWRDIISDPVFREDRMMDRVEAANAARDARYGYY